MEPLLIPGTEFTPAVTLDPTQDIFEISGVSRPENVPGFYEPVILWLRTFDQSVEHLDKKYQLPAIRFVFRLVYFNSASAKMILQLLELLKRIGSKGIDISIRWYYDQGDEQILEDGQDLSDAVDFPFEFLMNS